MISGVSVVSCIFGGAGVGVACVVVVVAAVVVVDGGCVDVCIDNLAGRSVVDGAGGVGGVVGLVGEGCVVRGNLVVGLLVVGGSVVVSGAFIVVVSIISDSVGVSVSSSA